MEQMKTQRRPSNKPAPFQDPAYRSARKAAIIGNYNNELQNQIKDWLWVNYEVSLPPSKKHYKDQLEDVLHFDLYEERLKEHLHELCNFYYALGQNRLFLASFEDANRMDHRMVPLGQYYSKHRLDPIWNSSKARKFRFIMREFLEKEKWYELYHPTHLVLTVPHKNGIWNGKRIYIREIIKAFNTLRKERWWKQLIAGGLYNLEVKKNKQNGYHIHLHVLCFQRTVIAELNPVNFVRDRIKESWKSIVGNDTGYTGIHYSSLYYYETDDQGNRIAEPNCYWMASDHDPDEEETGKDPMEIEMKQWKRRFVKRGDGVEDWIKGVMECLKYNFKPGCLKKEKGDYDIELICEILEFTKGDRFMSKFGNLHNNKSLSLNRKLKQLETESSDTDDDALGSAAAVEENLINPFTELPASPEEYTIYVMRPENASVRYDSQGRPSVKIRDANACHVFERGTSVLEAFTCYASRKFTREYLPWRDWLVRSREDPIPIKRSPPEKIAAGDRLRIEVDPNYCPF